MAQAKTTRNSLLLVLTAFIWGTAFVAQSEGGDAVGPYTFCCLRYALGALILLPVIAVLDKAKLTAGRPKTKENKKALLTGGIACGLCLAAGSLLQQVGISSGTSAGKAGFLTACYIVLVPVLGLFFKRKCGWNVWIAVALTLIGLYLLCMNGALRMQRSDVLVLLCSVVYAAHILFVDRFVYQNVDPVRMSCIQFVLAAAVAAVPLFFTEMYSDITLLPQVLAAAVQGKALVSLLYAGVLSSGVAYTLQIIGQKDVNPTIASLLMSLESVFAVLGGWVVLHQALTARELAGCAVIFAAVLLAQIPFEKVKKKA